MTHSQFLIGATSSGSGKTTVTLGLLRALKNRGFKVQPFKCGPDYIDTKFHELAAGTPSINLDLFLSSSQHVKSTFLNYTKESSVAVAEGVMGLFDGYDKSKGSSAEIAELLDLPIILVINPKAMAYSVAPIIYGFKNFNKKLNIAGVIFNMVNSENHYRFLLDACKDLGIPSLGYLPKNEELNVPSRHLGLNIDNIETLDSLAEDTAQFIEDHINIDKLLEVTKIDKNPENIDISVDSPNSKNLRISVASDEAFTFYYHQNIEYLKKLGKVTFFSPLHDKELPPSDFVYIPGGYPEMHLPKLSANQSMHKSLYQYIENDGKLLAECGGMMYLSTLMQDNLGKKYPMVNIFKQDVDAKSMKLTLGYRCFNYNKQYIKGHEFHYSKIGDGEKSIIQQYSAKGKPVSTKLLRYKNAIAGYTHIYWAEMENLLSIFD